MNYYTGIGSRKFVPKEVLETMEDAGYRLARMNYCLRSGKATGSDAAFQRGVQRYCDETTDQSKTYSLAQIYTPWSNFKSDDDLWDLWDIDLYKIDKAYPEQVSMREEWIQEVHPCWDKLGAGPQKMHRRNVHELFGTDLSDAYLKASRFVIYYAPEDKKGRPKGGTATAVNLAKKTSIRTLNLWKPDNLLVLENFLKKMEERRGY